MTWKTIPSVPKACGQAFSEGGGNVTVPNVTRPESTSTESTRSRITDYHVTYGPSGDP